MTTAQSSLFTAIGIAPAEYDDEIGAPFFYSADTTWLPPKAARAHRDALEAAGIIVEIVAAPKIDRRRSFERDNCPGF